MAQPGEIEDLCAAVRADATAKDVIGGRATWSVEAADCLEWLRALPDGCASLLMCSPPYSSARLYLEDGKDLGIARQGETWVEWMTPICLEMARVARLCVVVVDGVTEDRRYDMTPFLLAADLHRAGLAHRHPCCYFRYGVPGSGGPDWLRNDWEPILCFRRDNSPLPWTDNTACGHPPKWAPGGEMSHRTGDGSRVGTQWGQGGKFGGRNKAGDRIRTVKPSHRPLREDAAEGLPGISLPAAEDAKRPRAKPKGGRRPSGRLKSSEQGEQAGYDAPAIANPGNVARAVYGADEVAQLIKGLATRQIDQGDFVRCLAGGNNMGSKLAHENEAPYPERLCELYVRSFAEPGSLVLDCFSGSGTTGAVAVRAGRRFAGCDLRESMAALSRRRIGGETPDMFAAPEAS